MVGLDIQPGQLDERAIADHLRLRLLVVDEAGEEIAQGRDLQVLQQQFGTQAQRRFMDRQGAGYNRDGLRDWDFGALEPRRVTERGLVTWPALVDQSDAVGLRLFDTAAQAHAAHLQGVLRLLALQTAEALTYVRKHPGLSREALATWSAIGPAEGLVADLVWSSLYQAAGPLEQVRDRAAFTAACARLRSHIGSTCQKQADILNQALPLLRQVRSALAAAVPAQRAAFSADVAQQLDDLVYPGFLSELDQGRLQHYPRYLRAVAERLRLLEENPRRDQDRAAVIQPWWARYQQRLASGAVYDEALDRYRWLLHEYRVSVFAQRLGTAVRVSDQRLAQAWQAVE